MLTACGCPVVRELPDDARLATVLVDAVLGTGLSGPASGPALDAIQEINKGFPLAKTLAVDIPSGLPSDGLQASGEFVKADITVTFTAAKRSQCLSPSYEWMGKLVVVPIGTPPELLASCKLNQTTPDDIRHLFAKRARNSNKGSYGHVLVAGGSVGKIGAPVMSGLAAYRSGAGWSRWLLRGRRNTAGVDDRAVARRPASFAIVGEDDRAGDRTWIRERRRYRSAGQDGVRKSGEYRPWWMPMR